MASLTVIRSWLFIFVPLSLCDCGASIEEKHCQSGCVDEGTRLVCEGSRPRALRCPEYSEPCVKAVCSEGECRPKPDVGKACGPGGVAQCTEGYACLGPRTRLSALGSYTCALDGEGRVWCWGANTYGVLGNGTTEPSGYPTLARLPGRAIDVSAGFSHACAVLESGSAYCWGYNDFDGAPPSILTTAVTEPVEIPVSGVHFTRISSGAHHTCATTDRSTVYCWGDTRLGQCGVDGPALGASHTGPIEIPGLTNVRSISAGMSHTCAVRSASPSLVCWGNNANSKLGPAAAGLAYSAAPVPVPIDTDPVILGASAGYEATYALTSEGLVYAWGADDRLQLGTDTMVPVLATPTRVWWNDDIRKAAGPLVNVAAIPRAGAASACAKIRDLTMGARYFCWGSDDHGELGFGEAIKIVKLAQRTALPSSADNMAIGNQVTCISANEHGATEILCYGLDGLVANGRIGRGPDQVEPQPIKWDPGNFEKVLLQ
jgi:hypothetical protein